LRTRQVVLVLDQRAVAIEEDSAPRATRLGAHRGRLGRSSAVRTSGALAAWPVPGPPGRRRAASARIESRPPGSRRTESRRTGSRGTESRPAVSGRAGGGAGGCRGVVIVRWLVRALPLTDRCSVAVTR